MCNVIMTYVARHGAVNGLMLTLMLPFTIFSLVHVSMAQLCAVFAIDRAMATLPTWFQYGSEMFISQPCLQSSYFKTYATVDWTTFELYLY